MFIKHYIITHVISHLKKMLFIYLKKKTCYLNLSIIDTYTFTLESNSSFDGVIRICNWIFKFIDNDSYILIIKIKTSS